MLDIEHFFGEGGGKILLPKNIAYSNRLTSHVAPLRMGHVSYGPLERHLSQPDRATHQR